MKIHGSTAAEQLLRIAEEDRHLVWRQHGLDDAESEQGVEQQSIEAVFSVHIIRDRLLRVHVRLQGRPLFPGSGFRVGFCLARHRCFLQGSFGSSRLFDCLQRAIVVDSVAGIALDARNFFTDHGDNRMIHYGAAAGTVGFDNTSC